MAISQERIRYLLKAYTGQTATQAEEEELYKWVADECDDTLLREHVKELFRLSRAGKAPAIDWESLYKRILEEIHAGPRVRRIRWWLPAAAAAILAIVIVGFYFWSPRSESPRKLSEASLPAASDVKPGIPRALLRAGDAQVVLNKRDTSFILAGNKIDVNRGGLQIMDKKPVRYTLETPRGGEYNLTLADGTKVWINAASQLHYPAVFTGETREVDLEGEAYFQVKEDPAHPFIVRTQRQSIRVLGTEFNVQAYGNEKNAVTTLVHGKVSVTSPETSLILNAGEQVQVNEAGKLTRLAEPDVDGAVAWKKGYFRFDKVDIHTIMLQLSRWYDVDVSYQPGLHPHLFGAVISRDNNLSEVLHMLEQTGEVHFRMEGRSVEVMP